MLILPGLGRNSTRVTCMTRRKDFLFERNKIENSMQKTTERWFFAVILLEIFIFSGMMTFTYYKSQGNKKARVVELARVSWGWGHSARPEHDGARRACKIFQQKNICKFD
jgi:hypothetical protein